LGAWNGTDFTWAAQMVAYTSSIGHSSGNLGTHMGFYTTPSGSDIPLLRVTIQDDGLFYTWGGAYVSGNLSVAGNTSIIGGLAVNGILTKGGGTFKIDHPLDPENKYLYHSFVESPDMLNIYNGNVVTDANGEALIQLPNYFEALNKDFKYQLTVIGTFAQAIIDKKVAGNTFSIKTNAPNIEVSWQVTGVRKDAWANKNRVIPEVEKEAENKGRYLHPKVHNKKEQKGIGYERRQKLKEHNKIINKP